MAPAGGPRVVPEPDRRLAAAMREAGMPDSTAEVAETGAYSDFRTEMAFPKMELVAVCRRHNCETLARRVMDGEFDG